MVVQFVAFVGAYHHPGSLNPWVAAVLASLLTTWVTFVPCFVFVFVGAPYVERLRGNHALSAALTGITAAVVGVIANLAIYFAIHTLFRDVRSVTWGPVDLQIPDLSTLKPLSFAVVAFAAFLVFRAKWSVLHTLGACALVGLAAGLMEAFAT
jgi:chromate transporter